MARTPRNPRRWRYADPDYSTLVVLDTAPRDLSQNELRLILSVEWYSLEDHPGIILVAAGEHSCDTSPRDVGIHFDGEDEFSDFLRIPQSLKRYDGEHFYHA